MPKRKSPVVKIIEALTEVDLVEAESLVELAKALLKEKKRAEEAKNAVKELQSAKRG